MDGVRVERRGAVLEVTLDRPKANAIDAAASRALGEAFATLRDDPELLVGIVTGGGEKFFSAGWDLKAAAAGDSGDYGPGGFAGITEMFDLDKPVIAAVNGLTVGGGFEIALACDLILAVDHAEFFLPEIKVGIIPDAGGVQRLPRRLPRAVAMDMLLTGSKLSAADALRWGLVNRVVPPAELMPTARAIARELTGWAPLALRALKTVVNAIEGLPMPEAFQRMRGLPLYRQMLASDDAKEGPRAFAEKRAPVWKGR
jgi:crotonobetainyl-CoA hydratase